MVGKVGQRATGALIVEAQALAGLDFLGRSHRLSRSGSFLDGSFLGCALLARALGLGFGPIIKPNQ